MKTSVKPLVGCSQCEHVEIHRSKEKYTIWPARLDKSYTQCGTRRVNLWTLPVDIYRGEMCSHFNPFFSAEYYLYGAAECKYSYRMHVFLVHRA